MHLPKVKIEKVVRFERETFVYSNHEGILNAVLEGGVHTQIDIMPGYLEALQTSQNLENYQRRYSTYTNRYGDLTPHMDPIQRVATLCATGVDLVMD